MPGPGAHTFVSEPNWPTANAELLAEGGGVELLVPAAGAGDPECPHAVRATLNAATESRAATLLRLVNSITAASAVRRRDP